MGNERSNKEQSASRGNTMNTVSGEIEISDEAAVKESKASGATRKAKSKKAVQAQLKRRQALLQSRKKKKRLEASIRRLKSEILSTAEELSPEERAELYAELLNALRKNAPKDCDKAG